MKNWSRDGSQLGTTLLQKWTPQPWDYRGPDGDEWLVGRSQPERSGGGGPAV